MSLEEERHSMSSAELSPIEHFEVSFVVVDERAKQERLQKLHSEHARHNKDVTQLSSKCLSISQQRIQLERTFCLQGLHIY